MPDGKAIKECLARSIRLGLCAHQHHGLGNPKTYNLIAESVYKSLRPLIKVK